MMKLCCMSLSLQKTFRTGEMDLESFIRFCKEQKLDGIDIHSSAFALTELNYLKRIKKFCLQNGLPIASIGISNNFGNVELEEELNKTKQWIDVAAFVGSPIVRVFAGWTPEGSTEAEAWERTIKGLKESAAYGEEKGVVVALQNHNHNGLTKVGDDVLRMTVETNHPYMAHVWDTGQYIDLYPSLEKTAYLAVHVRAKIYEIETGEERRLDYNRIFPMLERVGYNGFVSIVYEGQEDERFAVAKAVKYLRRFIP